MYGNLSTWREGTRSSVESMLSLKVDKSGVSIGAPPSKKYTFKNTQWDMYSIGSNLRKEEFHLF